MNKKLFFMTLLVLLAMFLFGAIKACAVEAAQGAEDNRAVIAVQKQPTNKEQKQKAARNIACIIIQINGKVKDTSDNSAK